jgi:SAM-dependent methyltransferase
MVAKLRSRPEGAAMDVALGDFAEMPVEGTFSLVYVVLNTLFCALTQEDQVRTVQNVGERLEPGGRFVVDAYVPDIRATSPDGTKLSTSSVERDRVFLEATVHNSITQRVRTQIVVLSERGIEFFPMQIRYIWPSELDLMARLAGLTLAERYGGWNGEPFTPASGKHISVYRKE